VSKFKLASYIFQTVRKVKSFCLNNQTLPLFFIAISAIVHKTSN